MAKKPIETCSICDKELFDGDAAYATTSGTIEKDFDGFFCDGGPWNTVACSDCGEKISEAICDLIAKNQDLK